MKKWIQQNQVHLCNRWYFWFDQLEFSFSKTDNVPLNKIHTGKDCVYQNQVIFYFWNPNTCHTEVARYRIEYSFQCATWWFKRNNNCSTEGLLRLPKKAYGLNVVRINHVQSFARKVSYYQQVYRAGVTGLAAESSVKKCKTHRCIADTSLTFITE